MQKMLLNTFDSVKDKSLRREKCCSTSKVINCMTVCFCIRPSKAKVKNADERIMRKLSLNATRY